MREREYEYLTPITGGYLKSRSVRDCRTSNRRKPHIRVKAPVGITGGEVDGARGDNSYAKIKREATAPNNNKQDRATKLARRYAVVGRLA